MPMASEAPISKACTQRKPVAGQSPTTPRLHDLGSFQMASAKRGQITQVQTPTPVRKTAQPRDNTMVGEYASGATGGGAEALASVRLSV